MKKDQNPEQRKPEYIKPKIVVSFTKEELKEQFSELHLKKRFVEGGLSAAIERKKRLTPPREIQFGGKFEAHLLFLACSEAPAGRNRWTMGLLAEKMVGLKMVPNVFPMTVCNTLKKTNLSLT